MGNVITIRSQTPAWRVELRRFSRFLVAGAGSTLIDFVILSALKHFLGWATLPANLISYSAGIIYSYLLNRYWVYREVSGRKSPAQFLQFCLVSLAGLGLNNLLVLALETPFARLLANPGYSYLPAKLVATLVVLLWNFFANRLWTFNRANREPARLEEPAEPPSGLEQRAA